MTILNLIYWIQNFQLIHYQIKNLKFTFIGNTESDYKKKYVQKSKESPSYGSNFSFENSVISKNISLFNNLHISSYKPTPKGSFTEQVVNFNDLSLGDAVVHHKHGIGGRFLSMNAITINYQAKRICKINL